MRCRNAVRAAELHKRIQRIGTLALSNPLACKVLEADLWANALFDIFHLGTIYQMTYNILIV